MLQRFKAGFRKLLDSPTLHAYAVIMGRAVIQFVDCDGMQETASLQNTCLFELQQDPIDGLVARRSTFRKKGAIDVIGIQMPPAGILENMEDPQALPGGPYLPITQDVGGGGGRRRHWSVSGQSRVIDGCTREEIAAPLE